MFSSSLNICLVFVGQCIPVHPFVGISERYQVGHFPHLCLWTDFQSCSAAASWRTDWGCGRIGWWQQCRGSESWLRSSGESHAAKHTHTGGRKAVQLFFLLKIKPALWGARMSHNIQKKFSNIRWHLDIHFSINFEPNEVESWLEHNWLNPNNATVGPLVSAIEAEPGAQRWKNRWNRTLGFCCWRRIFRRCHHQVSPPCLLAGPQLMSAISFDISVMARWRTAESTEENVAD